jgi:hypothetical protein
MVLDPGGAVRSRTSGFLDARDFLEWVEDGVNSSSVRRSKGVAKPAS